MRLYLAVAVLMLAFVAYAEAQEETIEQQLNNFGQQVTEFSQTVADKTKAAFDNIHNSETARKIRTWFDGLVEKAKDNLPSFSD